MKALAASRFLLFFALGGCATADDAQLGTRRTALVDPRVSQALVVSARVPVIVGLALPDGVGNAPSTLIAERADALLAQSTPGFALSRRYRHVAALAGEATAEALASLAADPLVAYVNLDQRGGGQLKEAVPAVGADRAREELGVTGRGVRVAVLDTGVDTDHPDLGDAVVAQHCFTRFDCGAFSSEGTSAEDDHGHGSNVAGIIASNGVVSARGFAPDAELVVVKINDANDSGQESDWVAGLDWVYDHLADTRVKLVNLSIGTTTLYASAAECDRAHPAMASAIDNLLRAGVAVFAATGNRGSSSAIGAPACISGVIAVGAVYDSAVGRQPPQSVGSSYSARWGTAFADCSDATSDFDQIACFSNSSARVDLLAPGAPILSDSLNGRTELYWGTSQASPAAVGVAALLLQCAPSLTPAQLKQALVDSGVKRTDTRNGLTFPSVRALAAVRAVCAESSPEFPGMPGTARDAGVVAATDAALPTPGPLAPDVSAPLPDGGALPPTPRDAALLPVGDAAFQPGKPTTSVDCDCSVAGLPGGGRHDHAAWLALAALVTFGARRRRGFWAARGA